MTLIYAFLFSGICCLVAQIILDNSKLTPGHITSLFTILGVILSFLNIYDKLINKFYGGSTIIISNFGYLLYKGAFLGFKTSGIIGLFSGMLGTVSTAIVGAIVFSFIFIMLFKAKD